MSPFDIHSTVGEMVAEHPGLSRIFEEVGIDYCCGGKQTLAEACGKKGLDPRRVATKLELAQSNAKKKKDAFDAAAMSLSELADHIGAGQCQACLTSLTRKLLAPDLVRRALTHPF